MTEKLKLREWLAIGLILGAILTTLIVSKISERRVYDTLKRAQNASHQAEKEEKLE